MALALCTCVFQIRVQTNSMVSWLGLSTKVGIQHKGWKSGLQGPPQPGGHGMKLLYQAQ